MSNTPIYNLIEWGAAQASPWQIENVAKRVFEALIRGSVADRDLTAPPGSCDDGAAYLVDAAATGDWADHDGEMAIAIGEDASSGWAFAPVAWEGALLWVEDEDLRIEYDGAAWTAFSAAPTATSVISILVTDPNGDDLATGDGQVFFRVPSTLNGKSLTAVAAALATASSAGDPSVQIHNVTQAADMLSTPLTIDAGETDSADATTPAVIDTGNDDVATGDMLRIDVDAAGADAKGLIVEMQFS